MQYEEHLSLLKQEVKAFNQLLRNLRQTVNREFV